MDLEQIRQLSTRDMSEVDKVIQERLRSDVLLINQLGLYIINSGGKRLRPLLVLLAARACGYSGPHHVPLAAIIEFIHTATLLHDDVVDASNLRRGRDTANAIWGNEAAVLVGDFLYSRSFEMMVEVGSMRIMEIMAQTTNTIAEGEVMQLLNCHDPDTTEARYLEVIRSKTAKLFEAAARVGAVLGGQPPEIETAMADYGMHLGTAFQLIDDVLDYSSDSAETGKNIGDDLAEGKPTLPLIHVMREGTPEQVELIRTAIEQGGRDSITAVQAAIESTGAIAYTAQSAREAADKAAQALEGLPTSQYKDALYALAEFAVNRTH
ncbi:octaprenyl diphosphate synthase [Thiohalobacter thiocyanaticus]|uniref:Octaprenyl diphosphate synthase n=1 Tax=Thiohalobacter thiocyanaticus TaxID=585455 RepID=A0A426QN04_9GAMM|nr:octaprenyl diphosphate synthase [Thiohalobacter thiocyanaticus]RRQ23046.1 octaprenyl diphosphate synthase [Thiohalobacter thiocyanaticus]